MSEELPAGRELDALVAERVMGWTYQHDGLVSMRWYDAAGNPIKGYGPGEWGRSYREFAPSTDIAAAWLVVEKLIADGWFIDMTHEGTWRVRLTKHFPMKRGKWQPSLEPEAVLDVSLPLAICRAALKAVAAP